MPLNNEIERKWLIDAEDIPFDLSKAKKDVMVQGYISFSPTIRVRSENGERFILCHIIIHKGKNQQGKSQRQLPGSGRI